jgi:hypothetical protein
VSELSDTAKAAVILSDHASADASGKINLLGANWQVTGVEATTGLTPSVSVLVLIEVLTKFYGESFAVSLTLLDDTGTPVPQAPGQPGALRGQQLAKAERPSLPGMHLPPGLPCKVQMLLNFPTGLPLQTGRMYKWQLEVDGNTRSDWEAPFFVAGQPPTPVLG